MIPGLIAIAGGGGGGGPEGPLYVATTATENSPNTGSLTINVPADISEGEVLLAILGSDDTVANVRPNPEKEWVPAEKGWILLSHIGDSTVDVHQEVWMRYASASEPANYTFNYRAGSTPNIGGMLLYAPGYDRINGYSNKDEQLSATYPLEDMTLPQANTLVLAIIAQEQGGGTMAIDAGFDLAKELQVNPGSGFQINTATKVSSPPSTTGVFTWTPSRVDTACNWAISLGKSASGAPGAHRYWRVFINENSGNTSSVSVGKLEFREHPNGLDRTNPEIHPSAVGLAISSSESNTNKFQDGRAFDDRTLLDMRSAYNVSQFFENENWTTASGTATNEWIGYDFGVGNAFEISEVVLINRDDDFIDQQIANFDLEWSDDNITWTSAITFEIGKSDPFQRDRGRQSIVTAPWGNHAWGVEVESMDTFVATGKIVNGVSVDEMNITVPLGKINTGVSVQVMDTIIVVEP